VRTGTSHHLRIQSTFVDLQAQETTRSPSATVSPFSGVGGTVGIRRNRLVAGVAAVGLSTIFGIALVAPPLSAAGSATTTMRFYSVTQSLTATSATGQPLEPTVLFAAGDHFDGTDLLYVGQHQHHAGRFSGSDHLACVVAIASTVAERQTCSEQFAIGSAMLLATNVTVTFNGRTGSIPINGGTGRYKNARGTLVSTPIANSNNFDNTFTLTGVGSGPTAASLTAAATLPFYSVQQTLQFRNAAGQPIRAANSQSVGDRYDSTDLYYAGAKRHHASSFSASDHLACTFTGVDTQTCTSQIAIGGSLLLSTNVTEPASGTRVSAPINGGTGTYQNVKGTFASGVDAISTDVTITLTG
jgi:hypothetical protein